MVLEALDFAVSAPVTAQNASGRDSCRRSWTGAAAAARGQAGRVPEPHRPIRGAGQQQGIVVGVVPRLPHPVGMR